MSVQKCNYCGKEVAENVLFCQFCGNNIMRLLKPGTLIHNERYRIIKALGSGGMAMVYLVEDTNLDNTPCVMKVMTDTFRDAEEREYAIQKFKNEAVTLARLRHPNLPVVQNHFVDKGKYYLVMDLIEGNTLEEILQAYIEEGSLPDEDLVIYWGTQVCDILEYLHTRKPMIIHRDIKPDNLMSQEDGKIMLLDFGIARIFDREVKGTLVGTPGFAAPEQCMGKICLQSDIYSLGATLHRLLTGFDPEEEGQSNMFSYPPITDFRDDITPALEAVIFKALEIDIKDRYSSAKEFRQSLLTLEIPLPEEESVIPMETDSSIVNKGTISSQDKIVIKPQPEQYPNQSVTKTTILPSSGTIKNVNNPNIIKIGVKDSKAIDQLKDKLKFSYQDSLMFDLSEKVTPSTEPLISPIVKIGASELSLRELKDKTGGIFGLDIGNNEIKIIQMGIDINRQVYPSLITSLRTPPNAVSMGIIKDPVAVANVLKAVLEKEELDIKDVITCLPTYCVAVRTLKVPFTSIEKLPSVMAPNIHEIIPFPVEDCQIDYEILSPVEKNQSDMKIRITAVRKSALDKFRETLNLASLNYNMIAMEPYLIHSLLDFISPTGIDKKNIAIVNIGSEGTSLNLVKDGILSQSTFFNYGGNNFTKSLMQIKHIHFEQAEDIKRNDCDSNIWGTAGKNDLGRIGMACIKDWGTEFMKNLRFFGSEYKLDRFETVLFSGGFFQMPGIHKQINVQLHIDSDLFFLPKSLEANIDRQMVDKKEVSFMSSMGLALGPFINLKYLKVKEPEPEKKKSGFLGSFFKKSK